MRKLARLTIVLCTTTLVAAACGSTKHNAQSSGAPTTAVGGTATTAAASPIKIGIINSLTGPGATAGVPAEGVFDAYIKKVNAEGGVNGHRIDATIKDDKTDPTESTRVAQQLIDSGVVVILGPLTGTAILAVGPIALQNKVPLIVFAGTQSITDPSAFFDYIFRAAPADKEYWNAIVGSIKKTGTIKTIGIIHEQTAYGDNAVKTIQKALQGSDIKVVQDVGAASDAVDVTAQARKISDAKPDAVVMGISVGSLAISFAKAKAQMGFTAPLYGNPFVASTNFRTGAGPAAAGAIGIAYVNTDNPSERAKSGMIAFANGAGLKVNGLGDLLAGNSWATFVAAVTSIKGDVTAKSMQKSLETTCGVTGFLEGTGCFTATDHDGWKADSVVLVKVTADGKLETI